MADCPVEFDACMETDQGGYIIDISQYDKMTIEEAEQFIKNNHLKRIG